MSCEQCIALPPYSTPRPPLYSSCPASSEQRVQFSPSTIPPPPEGTYSKAARKFSVLLLNQVDGSKVPTYGRRGHVEGFVTLDDTRGVHRITVNVEGRAKYSEVASGIHQSRILATRTITAWEACPTHPAPPPDSLPFSFRLPDKSVTSDDREHPLPPSFEFDSKGMHPMRVSVSYSLTVTLHKCSRTIFGLSRQHPSIVIPFKHIPRSHPSRPIVGGNDLFIDIKTLPDEWHQTVGPLTVKSGENFEPPIVNIFVPDCRVFGISDKIPFHIQISGTFASLRRLTRGTNTKDSLPIAVSSRAAANYTMGATILRQVVIDHVGLKTFRSITLGEGKICSVPPPASCHHTGGLADEDFTSMNWDGEIQPQEEDVRCGFSIPGITVKDFISFTVTPAEPWNSPFLPFRQVVPISLTTSGWFASGEQVFGDV